MLVYGDRVRREDPRESLARIAVLLTRAAGLPGGIARHGALAGAFVTAGELVQGVADAGFAAGGMDDGTPATDAAMALLLRCAEALRASWAGGVAPAPLAAPLAACRDIPGLPDRIEIRQAEGFAFYALYPETYGMAAATSGLPAATRVIGLRSIGAPLGAMVAAALGSAAPVTLRPIGHPFRRELALSPALAARLLGAGPPRSMGQPCAAATPCPAGTPFAVVDEGPGLSGSSFGAVADWLEDHGVAPAHLAFFPGHGNPPGPRASPRHRARWQGAARHQAPFEAAVQPRLAGWAAELLGPLEGPFVEIPGGAWRAGRFAAETEWPPIHPWQERRKYLVPARGGIWLLKFIGLGTEGERKTARAAALAEAGFTPPVAGWRHGFLVERWLEEARPPAPARPDRAALAARVRDYLGFRARAFPAGPGRGASLAALHAMARHNTAAALGEGIARGLDRWPPDTLAALQRRVRPVETDNRLQSWEWLRLPGGRLLKADAVDHHAGHDLVGCQDIAWDAAGAMVELDLPPLPEADPALLALLLPCYCAFQLGAWTMAAEASGEPAEAARCRREAARQARWLRRALAR